MNRPKVQPALLLSADDVETQFYEALQAGDLERMMALWADDEEISCVSPGGPRLVGRGAIRAAFESMFAQGGHVSAYPERVRRLHTEDTAIHMVLERVQFGDPGSGSHGSKSAWVIATNVYLKTVLGWRLALHHASPGTPHDVQEVVEEPATLH